jgi:hypothetical protein
MCARNPPGTVFYRLGYSRPVSPLVFTRSRRNRSMGAITGLKTEKAIPVRTALFFRELFVFMTGF